MRTRRAVAAIAAAGLLATGCASTGAAPPAVTRGVAVVLPSVSAAPFEAGDTAFGLDVLRAWCRADPDQNLLFSPETLATGLGMAYLGARGTTAQAMARVLHLPASNSNRTRTEAGLQARTAALGALGGPGVTVAASNLLWADPSVKTLRGYLNAVATSYAAGVDRTPLLTDPGLSAQQINQAISDATDGQIKQLVTPGMLENIGWVLTSALYLHAAWATPFDADQTSPGPFSLAGGGQATPDFMHGAGFRSGTSGGWTGVSLPYQGGKLSMIALLPPAGASGCAVPDQAALRAIANSDATAGIALPKVSLSTTSSMNTLLKGLGMGQAFGSAADFSGLSPQACCIGFVQQAATLKVGEKGTVAAAATAVGIEASSGIAERGGVVVFDRPYLLLVTSSSGEPLFLARVANPVTG